MKGIKLPIEDTEDSKRAVRNSQEMNEDVIRDSINQDSTIKLISKKEATYLSLDNTK
jgi:hypothetical protein